MLIALFSMRSSCPVFSPPSVLMYPRTVKSVRCLFLFRRKTQRNERERHDVLGQAEQLFQIRYPVLGRVDTTPDRTKSLGMGREKHILCGWAQSNVQ